MGVSRFRVYGTTRSPLTSGRSTRWRTTEASARHRATPRCLKPLYNSNFARGDGRRVCGRESCSPRRRFDGRNRIDLPISRVQGNQKSFEIKPLNSVAYYTRVHSRHDSIHSMQSSATVIPASPVKNWKCEHPSSVGFSVARRSWALSLNRRHWHGGVAPVFPR